jgi:hypothetical protein
MYSGFHTSLSLYPCEISSFAHEFYSWGSHNNNNPCTLKCIVFFGTFVFILFLLLVLLYIIMSSYVSSNREEVEVMERLRDYLKIYMTHPLFWLQVGCWENELVFKFQNKSIQEKQILKKLFFVHDAKAFDDDGTMCIDVKVRLKNDKVGYNVNVVVGTTMSLVFVDCYCRCA